MEEVTLKTGLSLVQMENIKLKSDGLAPCEYIEWVARVFVMKTVALLVRIIILPL